MYGKKMSKNLKFYLEPLLTENVFLFDRHEDRTLPCVIVGYDNEEGSFSDPRGHYMISGYVAVLYQGYDDPVNFDADKTAEIIANSLTLNKSALLSTVNKPSFGMDTRPVSGFTMHDMFVRQVIREDEDHSTMIKINFDTPCVGIDIS